MDPNTLKSVLVVGAGTMGHSIAQVFAQNRIEVNLVARRETSLQKAMLKIQSNLSTLAELGRIQREEISSVLDRIHPSTELESAATNVDFVLETILEHEQLKKELFTKLDALCREDTIMASNTSGLNIFKIAQITNPERLIIHHWFAPPHIIPLVEIIAGPSTTQEVVDYSVQLMAILGKRSIVLKEFIPSFIVNRIQNAIGAQVYKMLEKGWATPEQIDLAVKSSLGIRLPIVGVAQTFDFTGFDVIYDIQRSYGMDKISPLVDQLVKQGHLGVKSGKGLYDYGDRSEENILKKRDKLLYQILDYLDEIGAFDPI